MKILVLGGTGAMGMPLVNILAKQKNDVYVTTRQKLTDTKNIHYIAGNAHCNDFLNSILSVKYDVIVDFMSYSEVEFKERVSLLLNSAERYVFLSSARVFANGDKYITENSPRLLDMCKDKKYLATDEYALDKAREENILSSSQLRNWTIIRPYITYNSERMQLGVLEKEQWLYRALKGKKIVFSKDIAEMTTTLTYGGDVAECIANIILTNSAYGEVLNCVTSETVKWEDVFNIYLNALEKYTGKRPNFFMTDNFEFAEICGNHYQLVYDRLFNRIFDNSKIVSLSGKSDFVSPEKGLDNCISEFVSGKRIFRYINWKLEGAMDKLTGDTENLFKINSFKNKVKYFLYRYIF